jgi:hypothetical protein
MSDMTKDDVNAVLSRVLRQPDALCRVSESRRLLEGLGEHLALVRLPQHVAAAPHGLDIVLAIRRFGELLA